MVNTDVPVIVVDEPIQMVQEENVIHATLQNEAVHIGVEDENIHLDLETTEIHVNLLGEGSGSGGSLLQVSDTRVDTTDPNAYYYGYLHQGGRTISRVTRGNVSDRNIAEPKNNETYINLPSARTERLSLTYV